MSMMASVRAHLVEVHLRGRSPVQPALHLGQAGEGGQGPLAGPVGQAGLGDETHDVGVGADHLGVAGPHPHVGAGQPGPQHGHGLERPAADGQGDQLALDQRQVGAGVDQAAEGHVAGDAGEAVPPGDRRHDRPVFPATPSTTAAGARMRATAQAAPNPLSMPTTTSPEAHEASMASRAVTPPRPAP